MVRGREGDFSRARRTTSFNKKEAEIYRGQLVHLSLVRDSHLLKSFGIFKTRFSSFKKGFFLCSKQAFRQTWFLVLFGTYQLVYTHKLVFTYQLSLYILVGTCLKVGIYFLVKYGIIQYLSIQIVEVLLFGYCFLYVNLNFVLGAQNKLTLASRVPQDVQPQDIDRPHDRDGRPSGGRTQPQPRSCPGKQANTYLVKHNYKNIATSMFSYSIFQGWQPINKFIQLNVVLLT